MANSLKRSTISALFWKLFERGGNAVVQMCVQVVMARLLAPTEFGLLSIMLVFVNIGNVIVQSGLNTALVQEPDVSETDYTTVFWLSASMSFLIYIAIFVGAPLIANYYSEPCLIWPLRALCLILIVNAYNSVQIAIVQRELMMRKIFYATIVSSVVSATLGIGAAVFGAGIWALVIQQLSYQISNCIALRFQIDWSPRLLFDACRARVLFRFGSKLLASGLLNTCYQSLSDLIIGKQFSTTQLGLVSQGKKYPNSIGNMLDGAIQPVMLSAVARVQDDKERVKRLVRRALKTSTFLICPTMTLFAVVSPTLVPILLGDHWYNAVWYLQVYCVVYALLPIHTANLQALNGVGRSDLVLKLEVIKKVYGIANVLFCAYVLKDIHLMVGSYVLTGIVSTIINAWPNRKIVGYSYREQLIDIAPAFIISGVSALVTWIVGTCAAPSVVMMLVQILIFMLVYVGLALILRVEALTYLLSTLKEISKSKTS